MGEELGRALSEILRIVDEALPDAELGFFLHGSAGEGRRTPTSDIDVLAVGNARLLPEDEAYAKRLVEEVARRTGLPIDFHILPARDLVAEPYVQLRRVGIFLGGRDRRDDLPEPTIDAAARESVLTCCVIMCSARGVDRLTPPLTHPGPDDEFFGRLPDGAEPRRLAKTLAWLTSGLLASRYGYVAVSATDATQHLTEYEPALGPRVAEAFAACREEFATAAPADPDARRRLRAFCSLVLDLENLVLRAFLESTRGDLTHLGPRCGEVIDQYTCRPPDARWNDKREGPDVRPSEDS